MAAHAGALRDRDSGILWRGRRHDEPEMTLAPLPIPDTRPYFRPAAATHVELLRGLADGDWILPTVAGSWRVRDVVAHQIDTALRRLSLDRDRHAWGPSARIESHADLIDFINRANSEWVEMAARFSPRVLTGLYEMAGLALAGFFETAAVDGAARFPVSWAGEAESPALFDIGREFTEVWHHQMQVRDAVRARALDRPEWLHAVLQLGMRALPHAYRDTGAPAGTTVVVDVSGEGGGCWTLRRDPDRWTIWSGGSDAPAATARLPADTAWRLLFNAIPQSRAADAVSATGDSLLLAPLVRARSVLV
jgi:hypothetical protein